MVLKVTGCEVGAADGIARSAAEFGDGRFTVLEGGRIAGT